MTRPPTARTCRATLRDPGKGTSIWRTATVEASIPKLRIDASCQRGIRPASNGDRIFAVLINGDEGTSGRLSTRWRRDQPPHHCDEVVARGSAEGIVSDAGCDRHPMRQRGPRGSDRLVRALPAKQGLIARREDSFARARDRGHAGDKINVDRTKTRIMSRSFAQVDRLSLRHPWHGAFPRGGGSLRRWRIPPQVARQRDPARARSRRSWRRCTSR